MSSLNRFLGAPKEVDIGGEKVTIHPMKVKDMLKIHKENPTPEEGLEIAKQMVKLSIPEATDEEIENMAVEPYTKLLNEIQKLNGFEDEQLERAKQLFRDRGQQPKAN